MAIGSTLFLQQFELSFRLALDHEGMDTLMFYLEVLAYYLYRTSTPYHCTIRLVRGPVVTADQQVNSVYV